MQFINSDNGSNIKRALLDMEKMEMTVEEEPLLLVDEDEDDWTNNAAASHAAAMTEDSINFGPCPVPVEDEFHPVALDEEEDWDSSGYTSVAHMIATLRIRWPTSEPTPGSTIFNVCHVFVILSR